MLAFHTVGMPSRFERMLRAKIRDLMAAGILPRVQSDGWLADDAGHAVPGERQVSLGDPKASCLVCEDPGPLVSYQAPAGIVLHLHVRCDMLWQEERSPHSRP